MDFRLRSRALDFWVDVRLQSFGGRWLAVAEISGDLEIGLATDPHQALSAALTPLGHRASAALLSDPQLIDLLS